MERGGSWTEYCNISMGRYGKAENKNICTNIAYADKWVVYLEAGESVNCVESKKASNSK